MFLCVIEGPRVDFTRRTHSKTGPFGAKEAEFSGMVRAVRALTERQEVPEEKGCGLGLCREESTSEHDRMWYVWECLVLWEHKEVKLH